MRSAQPARRRPLADRAVRKAAPRGEVIGAPPRGVPYPCRSGRLLLMQRLLVDLEDRLVLLRDGERDDAGDEPVGPHLVDLGLEVLDVLRCEVGEPALAAQVLDDRLALLAALRDLARRSGQIADAVDDLVERPDA